MLKLCRFTSPQSLQRATAQVRIGLTTDDQTLVDLTAAGQPSLRTLLEHDNLLGLVAELEKQDLPRLSVGDVQLLAPLEYQDVWAAGVTYLRSKKARMDESAFSANAYDQVYNAQRPELFFKALPHKVVGPGQPVGIRRDSKWSVPEPELALVFNSRAELVGFTIGNDMSARDIEGENLLYLPQAKVYERSCALGPFITVGATEAEARTWRVELRICRGEQVVFGGQTEVGRLKRTFAELQQFLFRCQTFPYGAVLLTGTGIVPPDDFTLQAGDLVQITITGVGTLENPVVVV
jgi:2-dehydro-3-deoxy-D-arabinonate dehydratase